MKPLTLTLISCYLAILGVLLWGNFTYAAERLQPDISRGTDPECSCFYFAQFLNKNLQPGIVVTPHPHPLTGDFALYRYAETGHIAYVAVVISAKDSIVGKEGWYEIGSNRDHCGLYLDFMYLDTPGLEGFITVNTP